MMLTNRKDKLALLASVINGTATAKQIDNLRKSREVIHFTLNLDWDGVEPKEPGFPQYHIELDQDWQVIRRYDLYEDGRIELRQ